jgi:phage baseplate assembly protein W
MPRFTSKFRGYSSVGTSFLNPVRYDLDLAKQDLLNVFNTRFGERIMLPKFGTIIWDLLFDPLDDNTRRTIRDDVIRIISEDPRWSIKTVDIEEGINSLDLKVTVTYRPTDETITLPLTYDKGTNTQ